MQVTNNFEKIKTAKRQAWNEENEPRKGDKRNKVKRDRTEKRTWCE